VYNNDVLVVVPLCIFGVILFFALMQRLERMLGFVSRVVGTHSVLAVAVFEELRTMMIKAVPVRASQVLALEHDVSFVSATVRTLTIPQQIEAGRVGL
jgi:hypothetical protein